MKKTYTKPKLTKHNQLKNITFSKEYKEKERTDYANTILHG